MVSWQKTTEYLATSIFVLELVLSSVYKVALERLFSSLRSTSNLYILPLRLKWCGATRRKILLAKNEKYSYCPKNEIS